MSINYFENLIWNTLTILTDINSKHKENIFNYLSGLIKQSKEEDYTILFFNEVRRYVSYNNFLLSKDKIINIIRTMIKTYINIDRNLYLNNNEENKVIVKYSSGNEYVVNLDIIDSDLIKHIYNLDKDVSVIELSIGEDIFKYLIDYDFNAIQKNNLIEYSKDIKEVKEKIELVYDRLNYFGSNVVLLQYLLYITKQIKINNKKTK